VIIRAAARHPRPGAGAGRLRQQGRDGQVQPSVSSRPGGPALAKEAASPSTAIAVLALVVPLALLALMALLVGCAPRGAPSPPPAAAPPPALAAVPPAEPGAAPGRYVGGPVALECAPFARALTGIELRGAAADWWQQAAGRYDRSSRPAVGAVLAFRRTSRLADGHAAVVTHVIDARTILVSQANWVANRVTEDMPVMDVSAANDWSAVRVWWPPAGQMGTRPYPTWGFILPDRPLTREALAAALSDGQAAWRTLPD